MRMLGTCKFLCSIAMNKTNHDSRDMFTPSHAQFHPTMLTVMGQVNQALTGYGAISVYGPQIFELLGYGVSWDSPSKFMPEADHEPQTRLSEYLTQANYVSYFILMTFAWLLIDAVGRRAILLNASGVLTLSFVLLTVFGGLAYNNEELGISVNSVAIPGIVMLFISTAAFGIGWLVPPWLIPTEIYPQTARAQGTAVSVIIWGLANFTVTLVTPLMFNSIKYWVFLVFAGTNAFAAIWTFL